MNESLLITVAAAAVTLGSVHTLAPDHWVPFAAVARAQKWSAARTARVTLLCGFGHVTGSVFLGLAGLIAGLEVLRRFGGRIEAVAGVLLIGFGFAYGIWGLRRATGRQLHGHSHRHYDHVHDPSRTTVWSLFLLFSADPCVAVIPIMFAAAPLGALRTGIVVVLYETATLTMMVLLVLPAYAGARVLKAKWLDHYGDAVAGAVIAVVGIVVMAMGW
jgi:nickel/cobalt transporter (NicO) family protein